VEEVSARADGAAAGTVPAKRLSVAPMINQFTIKTFFAAEESLAASG